jgi:hypothetical protein
MTHHDEETYCRGPLAWLFNHTPGFQWIPSRNVGFANPEVKGGFVTSGQPDALVHAPYGLTFYVECKTFVGNVEFAHVSQEQENWYRHNCVESGSFTLHYIAAAAYPEQDRPDRCTLNRWVLYLIPSYRWFQVRDLAASEPYGTATIPMNAALATRVSRKWADDLNADKFFAPYQMRTTTRPVTRNVGSKAVTRHDLAYALDDSHPLHGQMARVFADGAYALRERFPAAFFIL